MLTMKKRLFYLIVILITTNVCMANEYHGMLERCDEIAESHQKTAVSAMQMVQIVDNQKNCYKSVAYKIIDTEYTQNKQQMKTELDSFIKNSSNVAYSMQYPDVCAPNCGTTVGLNAANASLAIIKTYIQQLLYIVLPK